MRLAGRFTTPVCILNCKTDFLSVEPSSGNFAYQSQQKNIEEILEELYMENRHKAELNLIKVSNIEPQEGDAEKLKEKLMEYGSAILQLLESPKRFGFGTVDISSFMAADKILKTSAVKDVSFAKRLYQSMKVSKNDKNKAKILLG